MGDESCNEVYEDRGIFKVDGSISTDYKKLRKERDTSSEEVTFGVQNVYRRGFEDCIDYTRRPYGYIYITENLISGRKYIGMHRWNEYSRDDTYLGSGIALRGAVSYYGRENFRCTILKFCYSIEELSEMERFYIEHYDAVDSEEFYNLTPGGYGGDIFHSLPEHRQNEIRLANTGENNPMYGKKHTLAWRINHGKSISGDKNPSKRPDVIEKILETKRKNKILRGNKQANVKVKRSYDDVCRAKSEGLKRYYENLTDYERKIRSDRFSGENNPMYGKKHTEESLEKMREFQKINQNNPEVREKKRLSMLGKMSGENNPMYGKHHTDEAREKIRQSSRGRKHSEETKKKMSIDRMGHKSYVRTDEFRKRVSDDRKGKKIVNARQSVISIPSLITYECVSDAIDAGYREITYIIEHPKSRFDRDVYVKVKNITDDKPLEYWIGVYNNFIQRS